MWNVINDAATNLLGGDATQNSLSLAQVAARAFLVYVIGILLVRLGKSRMLSRATPLDILLGFILGSLLSRGINGSASLSSTFVASAVLVGIHWIITAAACRSHVLGQLIKGHCYVLIRDGEMDDKNMRHSHISEHDLIEALRLNANVEDVSLVAAAYKERSGDIGVVLKKNQRLTESSECHK